MPDKQNAESWPVGRLLSTTSTFLGGKGSLTPRLDAELLLAKVLKMTKVQLYVNFEREMTPEELNEYRELIRRRAKHEPVAYILGEKEFYGLALKTTSAALIPRPETEHLVDEALRLAKENWPDREVRIADIGCGSGTISLAIAKSLPGAGIAAVDISSEALALARENAARHGLESGIQFFQGDLMSPLAGRKFHIICANLPYIPTSEMRTLMPDVGLHEPHLALDGGPEGLDLINRLLRQAADLLEPGGYVLLEIWPASLARLEEEGRKLSFVPLEAVRDLAGHNRVAVFKKD